VGCEKETVPLMSCEQEICKFPSCRDEGGICEIWNLVAWPILETQHQKLKSLL